MNPLLLPYLFNVAALVPVGSLTLFGGERDGRLACQGKFPESAGFRTLVGSLWIAFLVGSVVGLLSPVPMARCSWSGSSTTAYGCWFTSCPGGSPGAAARFRGASR